MALSKKLYDLRKQRALSQEQLAEQLGVSRQAVSKWESGKAVPETDTLIAISQYFAVSLDELVKEGPAVPPADAHPASPQAQTNHGREKRILGAAVCILGAVLLTLWGMVSVFLPTAAEQMGTSSMITLDGNGIFLLLCLAAILAGAVLVLKNTSDHP